MPDPSNNELLGGAGLLGAGAAAGLGAPALLNRELAQAGGDAAQRWDSYLAKVLEAHPDAHANLGLRQQLLGDIEAGLRAGKGVPGHPSGLDRFQDAWRAAEDAAAHAKGLSGKLEPLAGKARMAGGALALGGAALGAKGLYDRMQKKEGAHAALATFGIPKTANMQLTFDTPEEAQSHMRFRNTAGLALGGGLGAAGLGYLGKKRYGLPGMAAGALLGGLAGGAAGRLGVDLAHDIPDKTRRQYQGTTDRLRAASGGMARIASDNTETPPEKMLEFFKQDDTRPDGNGPQQPDDAERRMNSPMWGPPASVEGGDVGSRATGAALGLGSYSGV